MDSEILRLEASAWCESELARRVADMDGRLASVVENF